MTLTGVYTTNGYPHGQNLMDNDYKTNILITRGWSTVVAPVFELTCIKAVKFFQSDGLFATFHCSGDRVWRCSCEEGPLAPHKWCWNFRPYTFRSYWRLPDDLPVRSDCQYANYFVWYDPWGWPIKLSEVTVDGYQGKKCIVAQEAQAIFSLINAFFYVISILFSFHIYFIFMSYSCLKCIAHVIHIDLKKIAYDISYGS